MPVSEHRRASLSLGALTPWWLLFVALFLCVALHQKSFDVSVGVVSEGQSSDQEAMDTREGRSAP